MIDFVKARLCNQSSLNNLMHSSNAFPDVIASLNMRDGTIGYPLKSKVENIEFRLTENNAYVQNSIHILNNCLNNGEAQNYNDFSHTEICNSLDFLEKKVSGLLNATITQLEFGFNINTSTSPSNIIQNNVLMHDYRGHNLNSSFNGQGSLKRFDYHNYQVKIYDKGMQSGLSTNLLRYEVRIKNTKELHKMMIWNLADLKKETALQQLFNFSMNKFDKLIILDTLSNRAQVPEEERAKLNEYRSSDFWNSLSARDLRNKKAKHKKHFYDLIIKHDLLKIKNGLKRRLQSKFQQLMK